jgi:beta-hydroxyacyl-ACP dehydratase FabZ
MSEMDIQEIMDLLPHRYPLLLVDRIISCTPGERIVGVKNVTINESFFQGHFPGRSVMPGILIIEAMAQTGGVMILRELEDFQDYLVYMINIDKVKFRKPVVPGDQLKMEVELVSHHQKTAKLKGIASIDGQVAATAEFTSVLVKKEES